MQHSLNTDLTQRVVLQSDALAWQASPMPGVERRMLARDGGEHGTSTSVVRYAAGASFAAHPHPEGEEILVLDGEFADEHGVYPAGTYLKNPPGSSHAPMSATGCTLLVKLRQLAPDDTVRVVQRPADHVWRAGMVKGLTVLPLAEFGASHTAMVRWAPGTYFSKHQHWGGEEIFVVSGTFQDEFGSYPQGSWIRSPHLSAHQPYSETGCLIFVKTGHLN
jgi:anti-sigma factor ChrR (cupin superfamily)